jgi:Ca2+/H+ antiporter
VAAGAAARSADSCKLGPRRPLGLEFTLLEVAAVVLSVFAVANLVQDGKTNWFEGSSCSRSTPS